MEKFTFTGFLLRLMLAALLVFVTFNPSGRSYYHWIAGDFPSITPLQTVAGLALLIGWLVFIGATARSIGRLGALLSLALFAALVWLFVSWGWLTLGNQHALVWIALAMLSAVLAVGMSWSHISRRLSGQADVDEVDRH